ncbi:hypothetical protein [Paenibacillus silviterrae]|nr:hypothetical protein [Paenibacillus chinjuensis]
MTRLLATIFIEANGELGYELKKHAQPVTMGELKDLLERRMGLDEKNSS